jgi:hypothetical protein
MWFRDMGCYISAHNFYSYWPKPRSPSGGRCRLSPCRPVPHVRASPLPQLPPTPFPRALLPRILLVKLATSQPVLPTAAPTHALYRCGFWSHTIHSCVGLCLPLPPPHHTTSHCYSTLRAPGEQGARHKMIVRGSTSPCCCPLTARPDCSTARPLATMAVPR